MARDYAISLSTQKIIQHQKLFLILDLDNTILHTITLPQNSKFNYSEREDLFEFVENKCWRNIIKLREHFESFLNVICEHFEIYIITHGTKNYAEKICKFIREKYALILDNHKSNAFSIDRIIAREDLRLQMLPETDNQVLEKSFEFFFPGSEKFLLILDDRIDVWPKYARNVVFT